jgi:hypothetical protein
MCGRGFTTDRALTFHQHLCKKRKLSLSEARVKAKEILVVRKRRRLDNVDADADTDVGVGAQAAAERHELPGANPTPPTTLNQTSTVSNTSAAFPKVLSYPNIS